MTSGYKNNNKTTPTTTNSFLQPQLTPSASGHSVNFNPNTDSFQSLHDSQTNDTSLESSESQRQPTKGVPSNGQLADHATQNYVNGIPTPQNYTTQSALPHGHATPAPQGQESQPDYPVEPDSVTGPMDLDELVDPSFPAPPMQSDITFAKTLAEASTSTPKTPTKHVAPAPGIRVNLKCPFSCAGPNPFNGQTAFSARCRPRFCKDPILECLTDLIASVLTCDQSVQNPCQQVKCCNENPCAAPSCKTCCKRKKNLLPRCPPPCFPFSPEKLRTAPSNPCPQMCPPPRCAPCLKRCNPCISCPPQCIPCQVPYPPPPLPCYSTQPQNNSILPSDLNPPANNASPRGSNASGGSNASPRGSNASPRGSNASSQSHTNSQPDNPDPPPFPTYASPLASENNPPPPTCPCNPYSPTCQRPCPPPCQTNPCPPPCQRPCPPPCQTNPCPLPCQRPCPPPCQTNPCPPPCQRPCPPPCQRNPCPPPCQQNPFPPPCQQNSCPPPCQRQQNPFPPPCQQNSCPPPCQRQQNSCPPPCQRQQNSCPPPCQQNTCPPPCQQNTCPPPCQQNPCPPLCVRKTPKRCCPTKPAWDTCTRGGDPGCDRCNSCQRKSCNACSRPTHPVRSKIKRTGHRAKKRIPRYAMLSKTIFEDVSPSQVPNETAEIQSYQAAVKSSLRDVQDNGNDTQKTNAGTSPSMESSCVNLIQPNFTYSRTGKGKENLSTIYKNGTVTEMNKQDRVKTGMMSLTKIPEGSNESRRANQSHNQQSPTIPFSFPPANEYNGNNVSSDSDDSINLNVASDGRNGNHHQNIDNASRSTKWDEVKAPAIEGKNTSRNHGNRRSAKEKDKKYTPFVQKPH